MPRYKNVIEVEGNYGPLIPTKLFHHQTQTRHVASGRYDLVKPLTVHLAPTLLCNHRCFFCTYGGCKSGRLANNQEEGVSGKKEMPLDMLKRIVDELAEVGTKGVIITGGGEPTAYRHVAAAMAYIKSKGLDVAMNTNGSLLRGETLDGILAANPRYIRVSLNAGSDEVHRLTTSLQNFETIAGNIKNAIIRRNQLAAQTDISVGYVVNTVNVHDIMSFVQRMARIEEEVRTETGNQETIFSLQLRPVSNYESSKHLHEEKISEVAGYLKANFGDSYSQEFLAFMHEGTQISERTLRQAVRIIEDEAIPFLKSRNSRIQLFYPKQKYLDIPKVRAKPYNRCYVCPFFLFIWPDGNVYHCIEWAGTPGFEAGNLGRESLLDILKSDQRFGLLRNIDEQIIHTRCAPICAHHEMNVILDSLEKTKDKQGMIAQIRREFPNPRHVNFL
ncbi:MAG: radical SAM protein [Puniceicoccales bacterium]|jgi:radical SAM protein with 4Fe4S-binding SPASM domain|nr:radical SAM protein [Puniceicoccales bacterium]